MDRLDWSSVSAGGLVLIHLYTIREDYFQLFLLFTALFIGERLVAAIITELRIEVIEVVINIKGDHERVRATRIFPLIAFHVV